MLDVTASLIPIRCRAPFAALPAPFTPLIGRQREITAVAALLTDGQARLVTFTGPAGVGKTRLAMAVAQALAQRPGLVLADIQLADDSSGIDAVKDILSEFSVPVIFITAFPERLLTGERPEPTFLITKPFQRSTVKAAISQALFFDSATVPA